MKPLFCMLAAAFALSVPGWAQGPKFEKQALELVRRTRVSTLEPEMPDRRFEDWFKELAGDRAGVIWQLSECDRGIGVREPGADQPACVEANALLKDGRKVVVMVAIGTFKKGITGDPGFYFAIVEQEGQLVSFDRLRDLPAGLHSPGGVNAKTSAVKFVLSKEASNVATVAARPGSPVVSGEAPLQPPPPAVASPPEPRRVSMGALLGKALTQVGPVYPPAAKRANVRGEVQVLVTISETGRVTEARAVSGNLLLRRAAVAAASQWVFSPTILDRAPVSVQGIITFVFGQN